MPQKLKSALISTVKVLFSVAVIYWLVNTGKLNFSSLRELLAPQVLLICVLITLVTTLLANERWRWLLISQGIILTRMEVWRLCMIGLFFNYVVPGGVGGDVVKGYYIAQGHPSRRLVAALSVLMDRLVGLFTMVLMAVFVMIFDWRLVSRHGELRTIFYFLLLVTSAFAVLWVVIFSKKVSANPWLRQTLERIPKGHHLVNVLHALAGYGERKDLFFKSLAFSLAGQFFSVVFFIFIGRSLGFSEIPLQTFFFVVPIGFMVMALPISPAGVGVGQAAFYYLFTLVTGHESSVGASIMTASQILQFAFGLIGAWYYVSMKKKNPNLTKDLKVTAKA